MDETRESRRNLQAVYDDLAPHSASARTVMGAYHGAIQAVINAANLLWRADDMRYSAALETRAIDIELQARRHLDMIYARERCKGCGGWLNECGPALWDQGQKCCPDCTHTITRNALSVAT